MNQPSNVTITLPSPGLINIVHRALLVECEQRARDYEVYDGMAKMAALGEQDEDGGARDREWAEMHRSGWMAAMSLLREINGPGWDTRPLDDLFAEAVAQARAERRSSALAMRGALI